MIFLFVWYISYKIALMNYSVSGISHFDLSFFLNQRHLGPNTIGNEVAAIDFIGQLC